MTDARLVGTNPETSELVPVAVNAQGQLKTEVAKIEEIPNDLLVSGNLTVTGTINGESGGGGDGGGGIELPPDPQEGQALGWVNGELGWLDLYEPPTIYPAYLQDGARDNPGNNGFRDAQGNLIDPKQGWDNAARELPNWDTLPNGYPYMGVATQYGWGDLKLNFDLKGALGKVLTIKTYMYAQKTKSSSQVIELYLDASTATQNLTALKTSESQQLTGRDPGWYGIELTAQWLCNRDEYQSMDIDLNGRTINSGTDQRYVVCHYWALEDSGKVALERQLAFENALRLTTANA